MGWISTPTERGYQHVADADTTRLSQMGIWKSCEMNLAAALSGACVSCFPTEHRGLESSESVIACCFGVVTKPFRLQSDPVANCIRLDLLPQHWSDHRCAVATWDEGINVDGCSTWGILCGWATANLGPEESELARSPRPECRQFECPARRPSREPPRTRARFSRARVLSPRTHGALLADELDGVFAEEIPRFG